MSFLRPHTISIRRPRVPTGTSPLGYQGLLAAEEDVIATGLKANIAVTREARPVTSGLPGATMFRTIAKIVVAAPDGLIQNHDIVIDQNGNRHQVIGASWGSFGYTLLAERLEV